MKTSLDKEDSDKHYLLRSGTIGKRSNKEAAKHDPVALRAAIGSPIPWLQYGVLICGMATGLLLLVVMTMLCGWGKQTDEELCSVLHEATYQGHAEAGGMASFIESGLQCSDTCTWVSYATRSLDSVIASLWIRTKLCGVLLLFWWWHGFWFMNMSHKSAYVVC